MAQLVARLVRNEKVGGSNPPSSTTGRHPIRMSVFCVPGRVGVVLCCRWCSGRRTCCPLGRAAGCARGRRPARSPSAPRASLGASSRSPARRRHRPRAPQPGPAATHGHRCRVPPPTTGIAARPRYRPPVRPCPPDPPAPSTADCCHSPVGPATHVKPSTPLLACALSPVKPTTPLQTRYTCFRRNFGEQRRHGFHGGVLRLPHWCWRFHLAAR